MTDLPLFAYCGRVESNSCKPFTPETLEQHQMDCPHCQAEALDPFGQGAMNNDGDIPDGAYWAMQLEKEGWFP